MPWIEMGGVAEKLFRDTWLKNKHHEDPDSCGLSEFIVVTNAVSGRKDVVTLFWENNLASMLTYDDYRIAVFEGSKSLNNGMPLKSHLTLIDGPSSQRSVSSFALPGEQEIDLFMEQLGVYDNEIDTTDPQWMTPLGIEVYVYLIRHKLADNYIRHADEEITLQA
ncbi:hypothetical protein PILCRDRAFT_89173 [Piloderma croceum F 1598]|uniref:Uncharacterized protein n=1 Tax=Piloderma croceum (strain F 1598) TaxID=765440 RepID=A0A0C3FPN3_PILCF|nr:hypothetical protein PILCRDRAFT_89173 [Piloderma croceum F 1598]